MTKKVVVLCATLLLTSCPGGNGSVVQNVGKKNYQIGGSVSSVYYDKLANVQIKYKDELVLTSNEEGTFSGTISLAKDEAFLESNLSFELPNYDFVIAKLEQHDSNYTLVVKGNSDENSFEDEDKEGENKEGENKEGENEGEEQENTENLRNVEYKL